MIMEKELMNPWLLQRDLHVVLVEDIPAQETHLAPVPDSVVLLLCESGLLARGLPHAESLEIPRRPVLLFGSRLLPELLLQSVNSSSVQAVAIGLLLTLTPAPRRTCRSG